MHLAHDPAEPPAARTDFGAFLTIDICVGRIAAAVVNFAPRQIGKTTTLVELAAEVKKLAAGVPGATVRVSPIGIFGTGYYATSKAGLIGLTKVTAVENVTKGITCNALAPGYINTDMMNKYPAEQTAALIAKIPMGRFAEPTEVADAALFLASDSSSYITGAVLDINGGSFI